MREVAPVEAEPAGIIDALVRVVESGQRIVLDRFDLLRFDLTQLAAHTLRGGILIAAGAVLLAEGWLMLMGAIVALLRQDLGLSLPVSLGIVAGLSAVLGAPAVGVGVQRVRPPDGLDIGAVAGGDGHEGDDHDRP